MTFISISVRPCDDLCMEPEVIFFYMPAASDGCFVKTVHSVYGSSRWKQRTFCMMVASQYGESRR